MIDVQFDSGAFNAKLDKLMSLLGGRKRKRIFAKIGKVAAGEMERNFVYGGINPKKWKENRYSTVERKHLKGRKGNYLRKGGLSAKGRRRVASDRVLVDSGGLRNITFEATQDYALVGSDKDYGKFHLPPEKSGHPSKNIMPVRDWLDFDKEGYERIEQAVTDELEEALNGH